MMILEQPWHYDQRKLGTFPNFNVEVLIFDVVGENISTW
jgi:hypothetical protein